MNITMPCNVPIYSKNQGNIYELQSVVISIIIDNKK